MDEQERLDSEFKSDSSIPLYGITVEDSNLSKSRVVFLGMKNDAEIMPGEWGGRRVDIIDEASVCEACKLPRPPKK